MKPLSTSVVCDRQILRKILSSFCLLISSSFAYVLSITDVCSEIIFSRCSFTSALLIAAFAHIAIAPARR